MARTKVTHGRDRRLYRYVSKVTKKQYKDNKRNKRKGRVGTAISRKVLTRVYGEQEGGTWNAFLKRALL